MFVDAPGGQLFVRTWKPMSALDQPPLILLHDSLGCVDLWRDFPVALSRRLARTVIAYDRLGFGRSDKQNDILGQHFIREEAEVYFPAVVHALGLSDYLLFGHSVGGAMALTAAARHQAACMSVISESAQAFVQEQTIAGIRAAKTLFESPAQFERLVRLHGDKAEWVLRAWTEVWLSPEFTDWTLDSELPQVRCPVLAIHGDRDEYGSVEFPRRICERVGGPAELSILAECGHVPHREQPLQVLERMAMFLTQTDQRPCKAESPVS
jgi:pimeloyl-ACP methyl ester carboxylesterase